jgi:hypothetical protein
MKDSFSRHNNIEHPKAGEEAGKPLAPMWIFKVMNPIMKGLLHSPLHGLLDGTLMLPTYTGCKTGLPIGLPRDREPTLDDLRNVPRGIAFVHFQLT